MTNNLLNLSCLVEGESYPFPVEIESTKSVRHLQDEITLEKALKLDGIAAYELTLWRVLILLAPLHKRKPILLNEIGSATQLDPRDRLSDVFDGNQETPTESIQVIVKRPSNYISEFDFLQHVPGAIKDHHLDPGTGLSSSRCAFSVSLSPSPRHWDILNSVRSMELDPSPKHKLPLFRHDGIYSSETSLRWLFMYDFGSVKDLPPFAETTRTMPLMHVSPSLVCLRKDSDPDLPESVLFPIEIKRPVVLQSRDLVQEYKAKEQSIDPAGPVDSVRQILGHMRMNGYRYGVLSTYEQTWFLKRGERDADKDLLISSPIDFDRSEPSVLQCYLWFIRLASADERPLDPPSDTEVNEMLEEEERQQSECDDKRKKPVRSYNDKNKKTLSSLLGLCEKRSNSRNTIWMVQPDNMTLLSCGGYARTFKASWQGCDIVVKKCDIWKQVSVEEELKFEARIYEALKPLQGRYVPELGFSGVANDMEMMLVIDFVGTDISQERLSDSDQEKIRAALSAIHALGVLHGNIRPQNILVQRDGLKARFYFVDFRLSRFTTDKTKLRWEKDRLDTLLRYKAAVQL